MNKGLFISKGLVIVSALILPFGLILCDSFIKSITNISSLDKTKVYIDSIAHLGGDFDSHHAHFILNNKMRTLCLSCDGSNELNYSIGDSLKIWSSSSNSKIYNRDVNPSKAHLKKRYWRYLFFFPAGILTYPFFIFLAWFIYEKRKQKNG